MIEITDFVTTITGTSSNHHYEVQSEFDIEYLLQASEREVNGSLYQMRCTISKGIYYLAETWDAQPHAYLGYTIQNNKLSNGGILEQYIDITTTQIEVSIAQQSAQIIHSHIMPVYDSLEYYFNEPYYRLYA